MHNCAVLLCFLFVVRHCVRVFFSFSFLVFFFLLLLFVCFFFLVWLVGWLLLLFFLVLIVFSQSLTGTFFKPFNEIH